MENVVGIDKEILKKVIVSLKHLNVKGWDSIDTLVGVVMVLEQALSLPEPKEGTETTNTEENN